MNLFIRILFALLVLTATGPGQTWETFEIRTEVSMAGRTLNETDSSNVSLGTLGLFETSSWMGSPLSFGFIANVSLDVENAAQLWTFEIGGWVGQIDGSAMQAARNSDHILWLNLAPANGQVSVREFLLPESLAEHALVLAQFSGPVASGPVVTTPVTCSDSLSGNAPPAWNGYSYRRCSATYDPARPFWIVDLTAGLRSPDGAIDLGIVNWFADTATYPAQSVTFHFSPANWGYVFTLHYALPGQPEMVQSLTAADDWSPIDQTASVSVTGSVAIGATYWLTRDIDGWSSGQPGSVLAPPASAPVVLSFVNSYVPAPPVNWQTITIHVPAGMSGGWLHQPGGQCYLTWQGSGIVEDYANYAPHFFYYETYSTQINPVQPFWLHIDGTELTQGETWYFGGWSAANGPPPPAPETPPPTPTINFTLNLAVPTAFWNRLQLQAPDGTGVWSPNGTDTPSGGVLNLTVWDPWHEMTWTREVNVASAAISGSVPAAVANGSGEWKLRDLGTSEGFLFIPAGGPDWSHTLDLSAWLPQPESAPLQISLSRWGHDLRIRQPNGDEYSIIPGSSQGDLTLINTGAWYQSYFYFDASGNRRPGIDFWVYDATTGEEAPRNETVLTGWVHLIEPQYPQATQVNNGIDLTWELPTTWQDQLLGGGFEIWRFIDGSEIPELVASVAASEVLLSGQSPDGFLQFGFRDAAIVDDHYYYYCVSYRYGNQETEGTFTNGLAFLRDTDGDGMPDAWEVAHGLNPSQDDANGDEDSDGVSNYDEYYLTGTPPDDQAPQVTLTAPVGATLEFVELEQDTGPGSTSS